MADSFQARFVDLVRNYTSTVGTSNFVLGAQVAGYRSFATEIQPGESFYYSALGIDRPSEVEVGRGTMQADGSISREAISGTLTDFSDGSKTVALVAAAEWFELAEAGASRAVASRAELAALANTSKPALLCEQRRAGLFLFDSSDLSAKVAADTQQGVCVAPLSDPTGASGAWMRAFNGAIEAGWFGAIGDGVTDDSAAIQAAFAYFETEGGGVVRLGNGTFSVTGNLWINAADVTVDAQGATVQSSDPASAPMVLVVGDRARINGGTWKTVGGFANARPFDFVGADCVIEGLTMLKEPDIKGVHAYIRYTADGFEMRYCATGGSDGLQCEASNCAFLFNHFKGQEAGGDDALAFKAMQEGIENIRIIGNHFEKLASFCSIGTQIGTHGVDDPDYTKFVRSVQVLGNSGKSCATMLYIKPGANSENDYRNGLVEDVTVSDNTLLDLDGIKFASGLRIMADRGAIVRNVKGSNNVVRARAAGTEATGKTSGLEISVPGFGSPPTLSDINLGLTFNDPYEGALGRPRSRR